ncbi:MAG: MBL fold metallo-hydrolase [Actinobacteria bacterium]|nr:MAG: MBL fold metallo-hydrolase [Actinomycetota bacterium]
MTSDRLTYVGHSTVLIDLDGSRLLTDPVLGGNLGPLVRHGAPPAREATENLDAVLISHLHHDHAHVGSLRKLDRETRMVVPPGSQPFFAHHGFLDATELAPGASVPVGKLTVTAVEAHHDGGRRRHARRSQAIGFLVRGTRSVYFAGDTDIFPGMKELAEELDFALLPIWGWGPTVGPGHLDPEGAAEAAALLSPRVAVPIHWGTLYPFGLHHLRPDRLWHPGKEFLDSMREVAPQVETRVLSPGEATSLA